MSLLIMCSKLLLMSSLENSKIKAVTVLDQEYKSLDQENKTFKCERGLSRVAF